MVARASQLFRSAWLNTRSVYAGLARVWATRATGTKIGLIVGPAILIEVFARTNSNSAPVNRRAIFDVSTVAGCPSLLGEAVGNHLIDEPRGTEIVADERRWLDYRWDYKQSLMRCVAVSAYDAGEDNPMVVVKGAYGGHTLATALPAMDIYVPGGL
ncbi:MAG: hypothetical protein RQ833_11655 [Sphingomonadaceae bacterium]|nr:hypothetical protein [Sphingomonadaceae bacterium]